ncbi:MAG: hypothetical protein R3264_14810 [Anaerolineae bacterium]|nr:hypothetical protein [Anaerolineae bacterium]
MGVFIGFVLGYLIGTRSDPLDFEKTMKAWEEIKQSEQARGLVKLVIEVGVHQVRRGIKLATEQVPPK